MPEIEGTVPEATVEEIDPEIEALLAEDAETSEDSTEAGSQGEQDVLVTQLTQLGLNPENLPDDLSPESREVMLAAIEKANERVRGFQSGFDRARTELEAKAKVYEQLMEMPEFHQWLSTRGQAPAPAAAPAPEAEPTLDINNLPADPMERLGVIVEHFATKALSGKLKELDEKVSTVGAVMGNMGWQGFVERHPDAPEYKAEIDAFIRKGFSAEDAYRYAKGANRDEKAIEREVFERVKAGLRKKREASSAGLPSSGPGGTSVGTDLAKYAAQHGMDAAMRKAIEEAEAKVGGLDYS